MGKLFLNLVALALLGGCSDRIDERNWVTMGTTASVKVKLAALSRRDSRIGLGLKEAQGRTALVERLLNAHDPESELSKSAALSEDEMIARFAEVSRSLPNLPKMDGCLAAAFRLRDQSGGAFDPRWKGPGTMDLGAIAKGYAVDAIAQVRVGDGVRALFDIGGNLKCQRGPWKVGIAGTGQTVLLTDGMACATSGEYFRGKHIVDARTGRAVTNGLHSVTVVHPSSAMLADGLSTICFILGEKGGEAFLNEHYPEARAIWVKR